MKMPLTVILILAGIIAPLANATDYYVSSIRPGRSDSNAGTNPDAPWATMSRVVSILNSLRPGDTVYLERGSVFEVNTSTGSDSGNYLKLQADGTAGNPVTISGSGYGSGNRPIIRRTGGSGTSTFVLIRACYVTIQDIEFDGNMAAGFATSGIGFWADGTYDGENGVIHHVQILNNYLHNLGGSTSGSSRYICGIVMNTTDACSVRDCLIEGNTVSDYSAHGLNQYPGNHNNNIWRNNRVINNYPYRDYTVNSAIQAGTGAGNIYENNYLNDTTLTSAGGAIRIAGKISAGGVNIIRNNVIASSGNHGIWFVQSNVAGPWIMKYDVYGNIVYNCAKGGITVQPGGDWASGSVINIFNNTLYRNWTSGGSLSDGEITVGNGCNNTAINIKNNLVYHPDSSSSVCLALVSGHNGTVSHNNNLFYRTGTSSKIAVYNQGSQYTLANVTAYESSAQNSDPLFINTANLPTSTHNRDGASPDGLAVQPASPAVGRGANLGSAYASDIDTNVRTGAWTIGAYQTASTEPDSSDTTAPAVSISSPSAGATLSGSAVTVSASASDDTGVIGVQFKLNGQNLGTEDTAAPYTTSWNTLSLANGSYTLSAVARDAAGNTTTSAGISVNVQNATIAPPSVAITSPTAGSIVSGSSVTIAADAYSSVGVAGVQFKLGGGDLGTEDTAAPYSVNWYTLADSGQQQLSAVVRDTAGNLTTSAVVTVTVDNDVPAVSLVAPLNNTTVSGITTIAASVTDSGGVAGVQFLLDGAPLDAEDTTAPYSVEWDTTGNINGIYSLSAVARDLAGNTQTSVVTLVTVNNIPLPNDALISEASTWQNQSFSTETDRFEVEFEAIPQNTSIDCVTGLSKGAATQYQDLAVIVRFFTNGQIDVRNGAGYNADTIINYSVGTSYRFRLDINIPTHTYSVYVRVDSGPEILLAQNYAFYDTQSTVDSLNNLAVTAEAGSHIVFNFAENQIEVDIPMPPTRVRVREN